MTRPAWLALLLFLAVALALGTATAGAESLERQVGPYRLRVQYDHPPRLDDINALVLEVTDTRDGSPVTGLERTLSMEGRVFPLQDVSRNVPVTIRPARDRPGVYEGVFVPPALGQYRFRLVGSIGSTVVDETFATGPGGLPDVAPAERDPLTPGALLGLALLAVYLVGIVGIAGWQIWQRRRPLSADGP